MRYLQFLEKSKYVRNKKTDRQARKIITTFQKKNYSWSKKQTNKQKQKQKTKNKNKQKTLSTSKILKYLVDAPCNTWTIRKHLNNEKIKHKKKFIVQD